jgi:arsenite-transporting ATPase
VLQETRRALLYLSLYGLNVDLCILNRVLRDRDDGEFFARWRKTQAKYIVEAEHSFAPIPIASVPFQETEPIGLERLSAIADALYGAHDPSERQYAGRPFRMKKGSGGLIVEIDMPFAKLGDVHVSQSVEELNVRVGDHVRRVPLPVRYSTNAECTAQLDDDVLTITVTPRS